MNIFEHIYEEILLERFIGFGRAYIIDNDNKIIECNEPTHMDTIISLYNLEPKIIKQFKKDFHQRLDFDDDSEYVDSYVYDFMYENNIFPVILDIKTKRIYVRPVNGKKPNYSQLSELKNWAIENHYNEHIIVDIVWT